MSHFIQVRQKANMKRSRIAFLKHFIEAPFLLALAPSKQWYVHYRTLVNDLQSVQDARLDVK